jgi:hypothetical protein
VGGELLVTLLRIAGDAHGAKQLAFLAADQHATAFGKNLIIRGAHQVLHEQRPLLRAHAHQRRRSTQGQRRIRFTVRHFETHHRRVVFFLKRFDLGAGLDHDDAERTTSQFAAARKNGRDDAIRLL